MIVNFFIDWLTRPKLRLPELAVLFRFLKLLLITFSSFVTFIGTIPSGGNDPERARSVEEAEAEEGPFPVDIKSMLLAEYFGTCIYVQLGCAIQAVELYTGVLSGWWQVGVG